LTNHFTINGFVGPGRFGFFTLLIFTTFSYVGSIINLIL